MELSAREVSMLLDKLQAGELSREDAERWAEEQMRAADQRELVFVPRSQEKTLWRAVIWLAGAALRDVDGTYLHGLPDIVVLRQEIGL